MILTPQFFRYFVVAVLAYVIDLGGFWILINSGVHATYANIMVKILAAMFGFFAHRMVTYQLREPDGIRSHAIKYFGLASVYTPISTLFLYFLLKIISSPVLAKIVADIVLFLATYAFTTCFVFTTGKSAEDYASRK